MAAGSTERTSGYFGDQTPSESKKPCFPIQFNSTSFISLLIYYISFVLRAMANFYKGALLRLKAFSALGLF
jgi:hypothetical protein